MALGWVVGAGAVALERALAGSTPYPAQGYGRNLDARGLFVVDRPCSLNRSASMVLIDVDPRVVVFLRVVPHDFRGRENV